MKKFITRFALFTQYLPCNQHDRIFVVVEIDAEAFVLGPFQLWMSKRLPVRNEESPL